MGQLRTGVARKANFGLRRHASRAQVVVYCALLGCAPDAGHAFDASAHDGGMDASTDAGVDASFDASFDAVFDGGSDGGLPSTCGEAGCGWCASKGACITMSETCEFGGSIDGELCWDTFSPCGAGTCWTPDLLVGCADRQLSEDFSSGRYNVHRYATRLPAGEAIEMMLTSSAGEWEPALFISDQAGTLLHAGESVSLEPARLRILDAVSGRADTRASVTVQADVAIDVWIFVTAWSVADSEFVGPLPTTVEYELQTRQNCPGSDSESVGATNGGSLLNGVRVTEHPAYVIADTGRDAYYGTQETVDWLRSGFDAVRAAHPDAAVVQVRDISVEGGGEPSGVWPHASHQSGRDVDITYHLDSCDPATGCPIADVDLSEFDAEATWTLFHHWLSLGVVTYIFVDTALQEPLYDVAVARGASADQLDRWLQHPRAAGTSGATVRHVANHRNHHHVRFICPADDTRCIE